MIAFIAGVVIAACMHSITGMHWALVAILWLPAVVIQVAYARLLNRLLGGADPAATYRARNLKELRLSVDIPFAIIVLSFLARALGWAGAVAVLFAVGWLEVAKI